MRVNIESTDLGNAHVSAVEDTDATSGVRYRGVRLDASDAANSCALASSNAHNVRRPRVAVASVNMKHLFDDREGM